jgi:hypothetical protein
MKRALWADKFAPKWMSEMQTMIEFLFGVLLLQAYFSRAKYAETGRVNNVELYTLPIRLLCVLILKKKPTTHD